MSTEYISELEPYEVSNGEEYLVADSNGKLYAGQWFRDLLSSDDDGHITLGRFDDPVRGKDEPARITHEQLYRHIALFGMSGSGKSTLAESIVSQVLSSGGAACYFDIKGDTAWDFAQNLPEEVLENRFEYLEPSKEDMDAVDYEAVLTDGKLLMVDASEVSDDARADILTTLSSGFTTARADTAHDTPFVIVADDFGLYGDELTEEFETNLSKARSLHIGYVVSIQRPNHLEDGLDSAVFGNIDSLVTFTISDISAAGQIAQRYNIGSNKVIDLDLHHLLLPFLQRGGTKSEPFDVTTIPPLPPRRDFKDISEFLD